jgi:tRNA1(Val) A37 N6-methylase TrmN6
LDAELTHDALLGGKLWLWQPKKGFRVAIDTILLAAAVPARAGDSVLDLGCGVGGAILALAARVPGLALTGLELQPDYAALARRNAAEAGVDLRVITADLRNLRLGQGFAHVIMNPPYFDRARSLPAADAGRDAARGGDAPLADWLAVAARRLAPRGQLTAVCRMAMLPEMLAGLDGRLGSVAVLPLAARGGRAPENMILRARKDGRAPFRLLPALVLHDGPAHDGDRDSFTSVIRAVLRDGAPLPWVE